MPWKQRVRPFDRSSIDEFFSPITHRQAGSSRLAAASKNSGNLFGRGASATAQTASKIAGKSHLPYHRAFASRHFETSKEHRNLTRYGGVFFFSYNCPTPIMGSRSSLPMLLELESPSTFRPSTGLLLLHIWSRRSCMFLLDESAAPSFATMRVLHQIPYF